MEPEGSLPHSQVSATCPYPLAALSSPHPHIPRPKYPSIYRVFKKDLNIFYSGHRGHRTWHPVIFSYGDTLKTMPTNHKLQDRIRAAVQTIDGNKLVSS